MEKTTAQYAGNAKSVEALTAKSTIYDKQVDKQKEKIENLQKALSNSKEKYGENDEKVKNWQISLNRAETELIKLTTKVDVNNKELEDAKKAASGAADGVSHLQKKKQKLVYKLKNFGDSIKNHITSGAIIAGIASFGVCNKGDGRKRKRACDRCSYLR